MYLYEVVVCSLLLLGGALQDVSPAAKELIERAKRASILRIPRCAGSDGCRENHSQQRLADRLQGISLANGEQRYAAQGHIATLLWPEPD